MRCKSGLRCNEDEFISFNPKSFVAFKKRKIKIKSVEANLQNDEDVLSSISFLYFLCNFL